MSSSTTLPTAPVLASLVDQAERLVALHLLDGILSERDVLAAAAALAQETPPGSLLAVHPRLAPASALVPHLRLGDKPGFVVVDMADVDEFVPVVDLPDAPVYALVGPDRGDDLANASPDEAAPELAARDRTPMLLTEGIGWVVQAPGVLDRNHCFMTIGSRRHRGSEGAIDARTPAVWIANGTGRDGAERRGAPKVGWCWWGNRHTWLGFASAERRVAP